jgi:hypothetical protein
MSAAPSSGAASATTKATTADASSTPAKDQKPAAALEEDDEFEDFPVEGTFHDKRKSRSNRACAFRPARSCPREWASKLVRLFEPNS